MAKHFFKQPPTFKWRHWLEHCLSDWHAKVWVQVFMQAVFFFQFSKQFTSLRSQYLFNTIQFRNQYYYQEGFVYYPYYGAPLVEYLEIGVSYLLATRKTPCWQESQNIGKALVKINCQQPNRHLVSRCIGTIQATITTCSGDMTTTDIK